MARRGAARCLVSRWEPAAPANNDIGEVDPAARPGRWPVCVAASRIASGWGMHCTAFTSLRWSLWTEDLAGRGGPGHIQHHIRWMYEADITSDTRAGGVQTHDGHVDAVPQRSAMRPGLRHWSVRDLSLPRDLWAGHVSNALYVMSEQSLKASAAQATTVPHRSWTLFIPSGATLWTSFTLR